jgi:diaminohydroxyphosphoribosylaminopyrimidine deaminase/5-amino-6-(5-phosphoribosylamino)uracil reductase
VARSPDSQFLARAAELAERGLLRVEPNPIVGCVIVRNGSIVGEGWHERFGHAHAERNALAAAGGKAKGAIAYVTLEPCDHHGRQPPCTDALIEAGVAEVVYGCADPSRDGVGVLRAAGIRVRKLGRSKSPLRSLDRPWVIAKWAMTLDGKVATRTGDSFWISDEIARDWAHAEFRGGVDAIVAGAGTVRRDSPSLTNRSGRGGQPLRVLVCGSKRLPKQDPENTLLVVPSDFQVPRGFDSVVCGAKGRVQPHRLLSALHRRGIKRLLLEGGPTLIGSFFDKGFVDQVVTFMVPKIAGGAGAPNPLAGRGVGSMAEARPLSHIVERRIGNAIVVEGIVDPLPAS